MLRMTVKFLTTSEASEAQGAAMAAGFMSTVSSCLSPPGWLYVYPGKTHFDLLWSPHHPPEANSVKYPWISRDATELRGLGSPANLWPKNYQPDETGCSESPRSDMARSLKEAKNFLQEGLTKFHLAAYRVQRLHQKPIWMGYDPEIGFSLAYISCKPPRFLPFFLPGLRMINQMVSAYISMCQHA